MRNCAAGGSDSTASGTTAFGRLHAAPMRLAQNLEVQLLLVAEMIVDRGQVRSSPLADRSHARQFITLLSELFSSRLQQPDLRRIVCHHVTLISF